MTVWVAMAAVTSLDRPGTLEPNADKQLQPVWQKAAEHHNMRGQQARQACTENGPVLFSDASFFQIFSTVHEPADSSALWCPTEV